MSDATKRTQALSDLNLPFEESVSLSDREKIIALMSRNPSMEELWDEFGASVQGSAATGESPDGKGIFNRNIRKIKQAICNNKQIESFLDSPAGGDSTNIVIVITGALTQAKFYGIDVLALSYLIARLGVRQLCKLDRVD